jgi:Coenzyme PQQ synthesis protein D (PqqD)
MTSSTTQLAVDTVLTKTEAQTSRVTRGEALVVLIDQRQLHRFNTVGTRVWELCDGRDVGAIVEVIVQEFEVERGPAHADVLQFLEQLLQLGALEVSRSSP